MDNRESTNTDCRSGVGKTVSIIDTINFLCGLLYGRSLKSKAAIAAIKDLQHDEQANYIIRKIAISAEEKERQEVVHKIVQRCRKDSPESKYEQWLKDQFEQASKLAIKAGQPKGHRQQYSAMANAYKMAIEKYPTTTISLKG